eukprot:scaffold4998_cov120-Isochrysis_galbana.AAC.6
MLRRSYSARCFEVRRGARPLQSSGAAGSLLLEYSLSIHIRRVHNASQSLPARRSCFSRLHVAHGRAASRTGRSRRSRRAVGSPVRAPDQLAGPPARRTEGGGRCDEQGVSMVQCGGATISVKWCGASVVNTGCSRRLGEGVVAEGTIWL